MSIKFNPIELFFIKTSFGPGFPTSISCILRTSCPPNFSIFMDYDDFNDSNLLVEI